MPLTRRELLGLSAGAAAGAVLLPAVAPFAAPAAAAATPAAPAQTPALAAGLQKIKHVVVVMQENRSFDHYFGALKGVRGFADRSTVLQSGGRSIFQQRNGSGWQYPWHMSDTNPAPGQTAETTAQCSLDLPHGWSDQHAAWNSGRMDSWVAAKKAVQTLGYLDRSDIPLHYALADAYTICDAYHCSALSPTGPNRTYLWSGTIDAAGANGGPANDAPDFTGLRWPTYAETLQNAGVSWRVYQDAADNYDDNALAYFTTFENAAPGTPLHDRGMGSVPTPSGNNADDITAAVRADVLAGTLPQVSWIVSNAEFSEHPHNTASAGAYLLRKLLGAIYADPAVGDSTLVLLDYDENDGFFDHVPPPIPVAGTTDEFVGGKPIGLGIRVPMIVMSPWTRGGWVSSEVFDHTSVIRFLEQWTTALGTPALCSLISAWRRSVCGDLTGLFDFANPVLGLPSGLPDSSTYVAGATCSGLPDPQPRTNALPTQEAGTRPARALPYQPNAVLSRFDVNSGGQILAWITLSNDGAQATRSAHYSAYANAFRTGGPWQYTVAPYTAQGGNGTAQDYFNIGSGFGDGAYDLSVFGPNRFLRRFTGNATTASRYLGVRSYYGASPNTGRFAIFFDMVNTGTAAVSVTITSNRYRSDGPWTHVVAPGTTVTDYFNNVTYGNGWYDFTLTCTVDPSWSQRFVGHLETGTASISGS